MDSETKTGTEPLGALTVAEFCEAFRICKATFYAERKAGRITAQKVGKKTLIMRAEAQRWADALPKL